MLKRRITKVTNAMKKLLKSGKGVNKYLTCKECNDVEVEVSPDTKAVTCAYCVQRQVAPPENIKPKAEGEKFPRGWALKATYIHTDGRIFEKGKDTGKKYVPASPDVKTPKATKKKVVKKVVKKKTSKRKK